MSTRTFFAFFLAVLCQPIMLQLASISLALAPLTVAFMVPIIVISSVIPVYLRFVKPGRLPVKAIAASFLTSLAGIYAAIAIWHLYWFFIDMHGDPNLVTAKDYDALKAIALYNLAIFLFCYPLSMFVYSKNVASLIPKRLPETNS